MAPITVSSSDGIDCSGLPLVHKWFVGSHVFLFSSSLLAMALLVLLTSWSSVYRMCICPLLSAAGKGYSHFCRFRFIPQVRQGTKGAAPYSWSGACVVDLVRRYGNMPLFSSSSVS